MKTVMYGGTFNPPHLGHENTVELVGRELNPDRFFVIPTYVPPHKAIEAGSPGPQQRLEMCRAAFGKFAFCTVSDLELKRENVSYTIDTLTELRVLYPDDDLYIVIGSDSLFNFTRWVRFEDIFRICTPVVVPREENDFDELSRVADEYREMYGAEIILLKTSPVVISSSEIRSGKMGLSTLSQPVLDYIRSNGLYGMTE